jgi:hypothetical protein
MSSKDYGGRTAKPVHFIGFGFGFGFGLGPGCGVAQGRRPTPLIRDASIIRPRNA